MPGFETVEWCANEDHRRAAAIRALSMREVRRWLFYSHEPQDVADAVGQATQSWTPDRGFASALHTRQRRLRLLGAVLELLSRAGLGALGEPALLTVSHPEWLLPADEPWLPFNLRETKMFRSALSRAGVLDEAGFLFSSIQGRFDPVSQDFALEYRCVAAGGKLAALRRLQLAGPGSTGRPMLQVSVHRQKVDAWQLSHLIPNFVPVLPQPNAAACRLAFSHAGARIPHPLYGLYLLWLHTHWPVQLYLINGIRFRNGRLEPTQLQ